MERFRREPKNKRWSDRQKLTMLLAFERGWTLQRLADKHGVTRQRVFALVKDARRLRDEQARA